MSVRVRFAPSPTGYLHVGGARTALFNYLFARVHGGVFILRIEDTDAARSTDASVQAIFDSLRWLGLSWDEGPGAGGSVGPYFQSERKPLYARHADALRSAARAYPCYCTPEELEARREKQIERGEAPRYDGRCRTLDEAARARFEVEGRRPALRFALPDGGAVGWPDVVRGDVSFRAEVLDDFVLVRSDGLPTYNFACVVDDHEMAISHVVRGDDHISNTPRQLLLYRAFGWNPPVFAHVPMILGPDGTRLSKRHGATSVEAYGEMGFVPAALVNFLALLGWSYDGRRELFTLAELERLFDLSRVGANPAIFNLEKLEWMNGQYLKQMTEPERTLLTSEFLERRGFDLSGRSPEWRATLVRAIGDRLKTLADAERYGAFALRDALEPDEAAWSELMGREAVGPRLDALAAVLEALPDFSLAGTERATRGFAGDQGLKAGEVIALARVALTGRKVSPGIFEVMWLLGRERCVARLQAAARSWTAARAGAKA
jgi:glutamyl-tRNA synthetase